jgi:hypothetical protein
VTLTLLLLAGLTLASSASAAPSLSWSATTPVQAGNILSGVSCPSFGLCVAVDSTSPHASITTSPSSNSGWTAPVSTGAAGDLLAISCAPATTFCVVVGYNGAISATTNANAGVASTWRAPSPAPPDSSTLTSVSCPSTSFCLAVDDSGNAEYSTNPTAGASATWVKVTAIDSTNDLTGVSCPTSAFCAAVDDSGNILTSASPTSAPWHDAFKDTTTLTGVSCTPSGACVAVDANGNAIASGDPTAGAPTWSETQISSYPLTAVACTAEALCVAGDAHGDALGSDDPAAAEPSWPSETPDVTEITGLSCTDAGLCAAVDSAGNALTGLLAAPTVTTGTGTASSQTVATLTATVNPNDATLTSCYFNYGTTTSFGSTVPCSSTPSPTGGAQAVSAQITGLTASTLYYFQIVATSSTGSSSGVDGVLTTPALLKPSPSIGGTPAAGETLTCATGVTVPASDSVSYTWIRDTTAISGATGGTYLVTAADETHHLYCTVTISGDGGSASASSAYVAIPSETLGTVDETSVGNASSGQHSVSTTVKCSPQADKRCTITLSLSTKEANGSGHHGVVSLGSTTIHIAPGASAKVTVNLNAAGRALLARSGKLKVTVTVSGTVIGVIKGTLRTQTITFTTKSSHAARRRR